MRIHEECMYPGQIEDVKFPTSAFFQWEDKWNAMELEDGGVLGVMPE